MKRHLIAFDLDDTIVTKLVNLSDFTVSILNKVQEMGHVIMPATARPLHLVEWVVDRLHPSAPVAMLNGSYLYDFDKNTDVHPPIFLTEDIVQYTWSYLCNEIGAENIYNVICEQKDLIITADGEKDKFSKYTEHIKALTEHRHIKLTEKMEYLPFSRFTIFPKVEYADVICDHLNEKYPDYLCRRVDWNGVAGAMNTRLYFAHRECNKWTAIKKAAKYLGIDEENIITFGDQWNDLQMLSENKNGYALKGSYAERFANKVTEFTCKEDGVARELMKIFNITDTP